MIGKELTVILFTFALANSQFLSSLDPCQKKETCGECQQTEECSWCMEPDFTRKDGSPIPRCFQAGYLEHCNADFIVKPNKDHKCPCEKPGNFGYEENSPLCNGVGTYKCGICECPPDFFGRKCECSAENLSFSGDLEAGCRPDNTTLTLCNNRGDCNCGRCECYPRENGEEVVSGEYCECDNFSCDRYNGELCSGEDHGDCICGNCQCKSEWDVEGYTACECQASDDTCITPYGEHIGKLCSGHGECECGECKCEENDDGQFAGKYCEECPTCPGMCERMKACVQCKVFGSGELFEQVDENGVDKCSLCPFQPEIVDKAEEEVQNDKSLCIFFDDDYCRFTFVIGNFNSYTGELPVWVEKTKYCPSYGQSLVDETPGNSAEGIMDTYVDVIVFGISSLVVFVAGVI